MSDLETRLQIALEAQAPAPRDPMFRIQVMERRAQATSRRRLLTGFGLAFAAAILGALALAASQTLPDGTERLAAIAAIGAAATALLAAPYLGGGMALRSFVARASAAVRTLPRPGPWF